MLQVATPRGRIWAGWPVAMRRRPIQYALDALTYAIGADLLVRPDRLEATKHGRGSDFADRQISNHRVDEFFKRRSPLLPMRLAAPFAFAIGEHCLGGRTKCQSG